MTSLTTICQTVGLQRHRASQPARRDYRSLREIRAIGGRFLNLTPAQFKQRAKRLRQRCREGSSVEDPQVIAESFALIAEAVRRELGIEFYDVQLLAGLALARLTIAEMHTGEGKTLAAALPAFVRSLTGKGVHVMTVNAYLAQRDYELLSPIFHLLGVSTGLLRPEASPDEKRTAYQRDITYGPGYEFGFDYLRDQASRLEIPPRRLGETYRQLLQGQDAPKELAIQPVRHIAIVDEADSVMLDEATTPMILSAGGGAEPPDAGVYLAAMETAERLQLVEHYSVDDASRVIRLTPKGTEAVCEKTNAIPLGDVQRAWTLYVQQALRAKLHLKRDVDYIVDQGEVLLVDEHTGRVFANRSWSDGLRQAVEAREGLTITPENHAVARISRQRFFQFYEGVCGLTGTATGSEREFWDIYGVSVTTIPPRRPCQRITQPVQFFANKSSKWTSVVSAIGTVHATHRPILVGTRTIEDSETLAALLDTSQVPYQLLNGKQDADEAKIIAGAGQPGAVTIATNMAGRGTDIKLASGVAQLGGLHVIGAEPHDSPRVDRQLAGRAARQGDPGSYQLFVSAEDRLIDGGAPRLSRQMKRLAQPTGEIDADLTDAVVALQRQVERDRVATRRQLCQHDHWLEDVVDKLAKDE